MNNLFNNNFLLGVLLAKDRPQNERILVGLTASQFQQNNLIGTVMLKKQVDQVGELEETNKELEKKNIELKKSLQIVANVLNHDTLHPKLEELENDLKQTLNSDLGQFGFNTLTIHAESTTNASLKREDSAKKKP